MKKFGNYKNYSNAELQERVLNVAFEIGGNITKVAKTVGKAVIQSSGDRAIRAIDGSGVNRMKKATRWEGFANRTTRDGIDTAGKAARVYYDSTGPAAQMGFGLKKRSPRKNVAALYNQPAHIIRNNKYSNNFFLNLL